MRDVALKLFTGCVLALLLLGGPSCRLQQVAQEDKAGVPRLNTVVCAGFRPGLSPSQIPGLVRSPISGAVFAAEPVPEGIAEKISDLLFEKLAKDSRVNWVSPREAAAAFSQLASSKPTLTDREIYVQIGKSLSAEAVLGGHVYRWHEREGTDYSANRPASVAFDLYLMSAADGMIWWKARFDKSQVSLTENLLDLKTFLKAKGRWMTADELAEIGLAEFAETFPRREKE
ncbi:MAG: hypothetical protein ACM34H_05160 [Deltaproteobacteria bacterium]